MKNETETCELTIERPMFHTFYHEALKCRAKRFHRQHRFAIHMFTIVMIAGTIFLEHHLKPADMGFLLLSILCEIE